MVAQGPLTRRQAVIAEGIRLVHHGDAVAGVADEVVDDVVDFRLVAGPQVEHRGPLGLPQHPGPREWRHQGNPRPLHLGQRRLAGGGAHVAEQSQHPVVLDQLAGVAHGEIGLVAVVPADQPDRPAVDAAAAVHLRKPGFRTLAIFQSQLSRWPGEGRRLAQEQGLDLWLSRLRRRVERAGRSGRAAQAQQQGQGGQHGDGSQEGDCRPEARA